MFKTPLNNQKKDQVKADKPTNPVPVSAGDKGKTLQI